MDDFHHNEVGDYFCRFSFGQFITLAVLELATLFFVFYLGARYGPIMVSDRPVVAINEPVALPPEGPRTVDEIVREERTAIQYSFPETLTDASGPETTPYTPPDPNQQQPAARIVTTKEESQPKDMFKNKPVVRVKSSDIARYTVQVGSYPSAAEASRAINYWQKRGYDSFMSIGEIPNRGTWYRVRIGGFGNKDDAQAFLKGFKGKEKVPALIVLSTS
jgi:cell division protein FtsN